MAAQEILQEYVEECARLARSGQAKAEESYYPAVNRLLTSLGELSVPQRTTIPHAAAKEENHPDVGLRLDQLRWPDVHEIERIEILASTPRVTANHKKTR